MRVSCSPERTLLDRRPTLPHPDLRQQLQASLGTAFVIERELGAGGMARVFVAEETAFGRRVVVKVLPPETAGHISVERFRREAQLAARLQHPHIVPLLNAGDSEGLLYYTMPFVSGESLRERFGRDGALAIPAAVRVVRQVAQALAHAHRHGVVHRDIKPENILIGEDGDALVADFGIAKAIATATHGGTDARGGLTSTGISLGTPAYMAPEQALGDPATDHRADLYALGMIAYEALAGSAPFTGRSAQAQMAAHATEMPEALGRRRPNVSAELESLVMRLLEKHPADRPQTADEVIQTLDALGTASGERTVGMAHAAHQPRQQFRARLAAGTGVVLVLGGVIAAWLALHDRSTRTANSSGAPVFAPAAGARVSRASVAVLPFANTSGDPDDEHFSDGLTDELIGALGKVATLKVAGRTSSFALKGKGLDVRAVGDTLHVATVLEGSVRRSGNRLKVTAQLADAHDGSILWAENYDRDLKDVFAVQEEIARSIAGALRITLAGNASAPLVRAPTSDLAAYDLYLRGRLFFNQRTEAGLLRAVDYFEQAVARDQSYARAYAGLADARTLLAILANHDPRVELPRARAAAARAIALDSTLADAHASLGHVLFAFDWNWAQAEVELNRAAALDPNYSLAPLWHGIVLADLGRFAEAEASMRQAHAMDPLSAPLSLNLGRILLAAGKADQAISQLHDALDLDPRIPIAHTLLGYAYVTKGKLDDAVAEFRWAAERGSAGDSAQLAYGLAMSGRRPEAQALLNTILARSGTRYLSPFPIAVAYLGLGDRDASFRWLNRGLDEHAGYIEGLKTIPALAPLHGDPRWVMLLGRLGLKAN